MKLLSLIILSVLCTLIQAITLSTIAKVSLTLISLNKPVSCFFGFFRRRKSPVQETVASPEQSPFSVPNPFMSGGFMNPFGGGGGGMFFPGFNPGFGMLSPSNRFPPQFRPPQPPMRTPQKPPRMPPQPMFPPRQQPPVHQIPPQAVHQIPPQAMHQIPQGVPQLQGMPPMGGPSDFGSLGEFGEEEGQEDVPGMNTEEAESFFTLLSETDESKCISRLICEMGANPSSGGEFGQTIVEIIGSLTDFPDGSKVAEYNEVLGIGSSEGLSACLSKFSICDEESYQLVKKSQLDDSQGE